MNINEEPAEISADDFCRRVVQRKGGLMWLLGAGASAAAGIPTASDLIWQFKQLLYSTQKKVPIETVRDLANAANRRRLQDHIDVAGRFPAPGHPDEYAALFEEVYPVESDRQTFLDGKLRGAKPSYGHLALATQMKAGNVRMVWTTNFDALVADACAKIYDGTGYLTSVALDAPDIANEAVQKERWPIEIKLHGDFRSRRLKNTGDELRQQDAKLRKLLLNSCERFGLVVTGYSGRDQSVMDALSDALDGEHPYPQGLFWLHKMGGEIPESAARLISRAREKNVEAAVVRIDNFDELLRDLNQLTNDIDPRVLDAFIGQRKRWTAAPKPTGTKGWPVIRLNATQIVECPTVARRIACSVGGYAELREVFKDTEGKVLFARNRTGVLAFGDDNVLRQKLDPFKIESFDIFTIEIERLRRDSQERGLIRSALTLALARSRKLHVQQRRVADFLYPIDDALPEFKKLRELAGKLSGTVADHPGLSWHEGVSIRLDWADDRLWLLAEPRTVFNGIDEHNKAVAADFARERSFARYNGVLNSFIGFWSEYLSGAGEEFATFATADGVNAKFRLSKDSAFSRRVTA